MVVAEAGEVVGDLVEEREFGASPDRGLDEALASDERGGRMAVPVSGVDGDGDRDTVAEFGMEALAGQDAVDVGLAFLDGREPFAVLGLGFGVVGLLPLAVPHELLLRVLMQSGQEHHCTPGEQSSQTLFTR